MTLYGRTTIPAGARGFDALGDIADPNRLVRDGWRFRTYYISQRSNYSTKITDATRRTARARIQPVLDAGLGVLLNYEAAIDRWRTGFVGGKADGEWSRQLCADLGYPRGLPVVVSYDEETRTSGGQVSSVAIAYGEAFADALNPGWTFGIYGGTPIMHELAHRCECGMQAMASSWSLGNWPAAVVHLKQRRPTAAETAAMPYATRNTLDVDVTTRPVEMWGLIDSFPEPVPVPPSPTPPPPKPTPPPVPHPTPKDDDIVFAGFWQFEGQPNVYAVYSNCEKVFVADPDMLSSLQALAQLSGKSPDVNVTNDAALWRALGPVRPGTANGGGADQWGYVAG